MTSSHRLTLLLGYSGLIPFVVLALIALSSDTYQQTARDAAELYAFGIISFLCGSWWGLALRDDSPTTFWFSNGIFLLGFFAFILFPFWWSLTAAVLLICLLLIEQRSHLFSPFPPHYRNLRAQLSVIASISMFLLHFFTSAGDPVIV